MSLGDMSALLGMELETTAPTLVQLMYIVSASVSGGLFFPKSYLKVGGATNTQVFTVFLFLLDNDYTG